VEPLISICIPAFNAEPWIADCIQSAIDQSWPRKEIIVVDDGSTDGTLQVARRFQQANLKVIAQPNQGACSARNRAFAEAQGDYLQWLDADDLLHPRKIAVQLAARPDPSDQLTLFSGSWARFFYRPHAARFHEGALWRDLSPSEWLMRHFETGELIASHAWLVSRKLSEAGGPWNESLTRNQDGEYICRIVSASASVKFVAAARCYYRRSGTGSVSFRTSRAALESIFISAESTSRSLLTVDASPRARRACARRFAYCMKECHGLANDLVDRCRERIADLGVPLEDVAFPIRYPAFEGLLKSASFQKLKSVRAAVKVRFCAGWDRYLAHRERRGRETVDPR
jgi:glycosyltransferase involved in cell wall biosynthesis